LVVKQVKAAGGGGGGSDRPTSSVIRTIND